MDHVRSPTQAVIFWNKAGRGEGMDTLQSKNYLSRIEHRGEIHTDLSCLTQLMEEHLKAVPFENLEVFDEGKVPSLETEDIYKKIVLHKRGGYCFELNKLFYELLKGLGFQAVPVGVRILWKKSKLPPMLHRATLVTFEDGLYYCDIGYGGPGPKYPVRLEDGIHKEKNGEFRVNMKPADTDGEILIGRKKDNEYLPILRFSPEPVLEEDFELMNFYCAKAPDVLFTQKRVVSISTDSGSVALTGDTLTIQRADGTIETRTPCSVDETKEWMRKYFGIE